LETNAVIDALPSFITGDHYGPDDNFDSQIDSQIRDLHRRISSLSVTENQIDKVEGCLKIADIDPELALIVTTCLRLAGGWTTNEKWRRGESNSRAVTFRKELLRVYLLI